MPLLAAPLQHTRYNSAQRAQQIGVQHRAARSEPGAGQKLGTHLAGDQVLHAWRRWPHPAAACR
jgi:hypothetical protein